MIYLDNAATTLRKPTGVGEAMVNALNTLGNSARGVNEGSLAAARSIYGARAGIAAFFGCARPDHVVFTSNATEALNTAIYGLLRSGDHVITTELEHNSVLRPLYRMEAERDVRLSFLPTDERGYPVYEALDGLFRPETRAVICTHASNLTGNLVDLKTMSEAARRHGALFIVDAAQTAGTRRIDMEEPGIDVLCFTGHKGLMGPQGIGGMCIREGVTFRPFKVGGTGVQSYSPTQPTQLPTLLEAGTLNGPGIAGLAAAIGFLNDTGIENVHRRELALTRRFTELIRDIPGLRTYGDLTGDHAAIVALNIRDLDSGIVSERLMEDYGIAVRAGAHCAPRMHEVLETKAQGAVRFSFSWFTTEEEIDAAAAALWEIAKGR